MHSGGAYGSDFYWGVIGAQYGVIPHHYYYEAEGYDLPPYRNELILELSNDKYVETPKLKGYVEVLPIIIDSNEIGKVYFISNTKIDSNELLKKLRDIVIDLIN